MKTAGMVWMLAACGAWADWGAVPPGWRAKGASGPVSWEEAEGVLRVHDPAVEDFARAVFSRLQDCAEGRRVARLLLGEYRRDGRWLVVTGGPLPGGAAALADPDAQSLTLDPSSDEFSSAASLAREMRRLYDQAAVQKAAPEFFSVFSRDFGREQSARLSGMLAAVELSSEGGAGLAGEARRLADDPAAYWERLMLSTPEFALSLTRSEMADPAGAYRRRLEAAGRAPLEVRIALEARIETLSVQQARAFQAAAKDELYGAMDRDFQEGQAALLKKLGGGPR
jgi:hypothetical protein